MTKVAVCACLLLLSVLGASAQTGKSDYFVFINYATQTGPNGFDGRLYNIEGDNVAVMNLLKRASLTDTTERNVYDTTLFPLLAGEKEQITAAIKSIDTLKSAFNFCIPDDGLRFQISCGVGSVQHDADVLNGYNDKIFYFVDFINKHVSKKYQIVYKKDLLIRLQSDCDALKKG